ncbi:recombinase family protein [Pedobacter nutrimenti]|uniref:DNA invertase Pin-like site-specific DNA recombinase n=1 Tax=Pedobacter nutrimenti TaxID=1241337 RepID=A0A318UDM1_9SPHI|nr:recombinase family protein [Pedobacter nutrimenti]PYF68484.1 DNA invertase Pin-like site-specific DNA recombinase [Pedobacter nutrimenti]
MLIGYIRVSKEDQNPDMQIDAFKKFACEKLFFEKISGAKTERAEFDKMISILRPGDTVLVWEISRLGRSAPEMIKIVDEWFKMGVGLKSITEPFVDSSSEWGDFLAKFFLLMADSERKRLIRRTREGLSSARARGRIGGKKKGLTAAAMATAKNAVIFYNSKILTTNEMCSALKISKATLYKYLRYEGVEIAGWVKTPNLNRD